MRIQVLGTGCSSCKALYECVQRALVETHIEAQVEWIDDLQQILTFDVLMLPGLVVDGVVKAAGGIPKFEEIKTLLLAANGNLRNGAT
jgi:small redox-active disulfide protein 2